MRKLIVVAVAAGVVGTLAYSQTRAPKQILTWPGHYMVALGMPVFRAQIFLDAGVAHDNTEADGGNVNYTFGGGEHVCVQSTMDFCFEANKRAANMTASCGKAVRVTANSERCFFLGADAGVISFSATSGQGHVNIYETQL